jgi:hypothetical protein
MSYRSVADGSACLPCPVNSYLADDALDRYEHDSQDDCIICDGSNGPCVAANAVDLAAMLGLALPGTTDFNIVLGTEEAYTSE